jgi:hypothetical protein
MERIGDNNLDLYKTLIEKKYAPIIEEQKNKAKLNLMKQVKRELRDNPKLIKDL